MRYQSRPDGCTIRLSDGATIPDCPGNNDYEAMMLDLREDPDCLGSAPAPETREFAPHDAPPAPPVEPTPAE